MSTTILKSDPIKDITNALADMLEKVDPDNYIMPWNASAVSALRPHNPLTGTRYRGYNWFNLVLRSGGASSLGLIMEGTTFPSGRYATYRQWTKLGNQVRKGEHGTRIIFYNSPKADEDKDDKKRGGFLKSYAVFAAEQVDGAESFLGHQVKPDAQDAGIETFIQKSGIRIMENRAGNRCFHTQEGPIIELMPREVFNSWSAFYSTSFHELVHATKRTLGRHDIIESYLEDPKERYAFEELVAEIGSAMLCGTFGILNQSLKEHACYVADWIRSLRNDRKYLMKAAGLAQKAVDHLLEVGGIAQSPTAEPETTEEPHEAA